MTHPERPGLVYMPFCDEVVVDARTGATRLRDRRVDGTRDYDIRPGRGYVVCLGTGGPDLHTRDPAVACRWAWNHARRLGRTVTVVLDDRRTLCDFVPPGPVDEALLVPLTPALASLWPP